MTYIINKGALISSGGLDTNLTESESDEEMSSSTSSTGGASNLQTGGDVSSKDEEAIRPSTRLACASQQETHPAISSGDFGKVVKLKAERRLSDDEKFALLNHCFVPSSYTFPTRVISGRQRSFQHSWLGKYNGLCYSVTENGGYCKFCVLFAKCSPSVARLGVLVEKPFTNFKKASEILGDHFQGTGASSKGRISHKAAVEAAMAFTAVMENKALAIDAQLSSIRRKHIAENRLKLKSIVETVILCGRQGIPLRGHRDDNPDVQETPLANHGNFLALLHFRVQAGDDALKEHLQNSRANARYTSYGIQNQLITICGDLIRAKILENISIIADEATDTANVEQLSLSIRYVHNNAPCEKFLGFLKCEAGTTGEAIADMILTQLDQWQLEPQLLRGQAYDGAGAMAGQTKAVAARICAQYPKASYSHCASHRLNLCIVKSCSIREVSNMMQTADSICRFFNYSPKRQLALERWIDDVLPGEKRHKLKELCRTRWVERHEAFEIFLDLFLPTVSCLEEIAQAPGTAWNRETRHDAQSFLVAISQFTFIVALVLTQKVLAYTKALSVKLQGRYVDVAYAHREIQGVKDTLKRARSRVDNFHDLVYKEALEIACGVSVDESVPRLATRQQHRQNTPSDNAQEYYKRTLTIQMLDFLITELDSRFDVAASLNITEFMHLLPSQLATSVVQRQHLSHILGMYADDLPCIRSLDAELELWQTKWEMEGRLAKELNTPEKVLVNIEKGFFPNISTLFHIMATLPVTSCECEPSISMLKLAKSSLRSTTSEDRLNGLLMMQCHRDVHLNADEVVTKFSQCQPRRMELQ